MNRFISIFLALALLVPGVTSAEDQGLFHRAASLALGVAAKSAQKGIELDTEKRAGASPGQAEKIRYNSKLVRLGLQVVGDGLIEKATGVDVGNFIVKSKIKKGEKFSVGPFNVMQEKGRGTGMDAHHVGQKAVLKKMIPGYNEMTAPSILVPKVGHTRRGERGIVSRSSSGLNSPRDVLARDTKELRRVYPDIPNNQLRELIKMNKESYPTLKFREAANRSRELLEF